MTASPTPFFAKNANKSDGEHYAKSASCSEAPGTGSKMELVQPASAAMPSEEEIARVLCIAQGNDPDFDYDPNGVSDLPGTNLCWKLYLGQARAVLALFAPILAEKERVERSRDTLKEHCERLDDALRQNAAALQGKNEVLHAVAEAHSIVMEAAEAALSHRVGLPSSGGYLRDNDASRKALADLAAVVRAYR